MPGRPKKYQMDGSTYSKIGMYAAIYAKKSHILRVKPSHARRNSTALPSTHRQHPRMNNMIVLSAD